MHWGTWEQLQPTSLRTLQAPVSHFPLICLISSAWPMKEETLLKWNPLTSLRTLFGYLTTKIPVLKRLEHILVMACMPHTPPCTHVLAHSRRSAAWQGLFWKSRGVCRCQVSMYRCVRTPINKIQYKCSILLQIQWCAPKWPNLPYCPLVSLWSLELAC